MHHPCAGTALIQASALHRHYPCGVVGIPVSGAKHPPAQPSAGGKGWCWLKGGSRAVHRTSFLFKLGGLCAHTIPPFLSFMAVY